MENYEQVYSFLPYFKERHENRKNGIPKQTSFVTDEEVMDTRHSKEMEQFAEIVYSSGFIDTKYSTTLYKYGVQSDEDLEIRLPFADKALLQAILTKMIQSEQFVSGAWITYEEKGMFLTALERLGELHGHSREEDGKQEG